MAKNKYAIGEERVTRSFSVPDIRAVDDGSYIEGHAAVYDQITNIGDWFYEIIERGAFNECDFDDVLFTANHKIQEIPLARSRRNNGNSTLTLRTDDIGLYIKANMDTENNTEAKNLYSAVKREDMNGMSFIFYIKEQRWEDLDTDMPTRHIIKIAKVIETSAVNFPAYSGTDIHARDQRSLENARIALENARSELDNSTMAGENLEILRLRNQILAKG